MEDGKWKIQSAFTLIELLIVISILSILITLGIEAFTASQQHGRDVERKSDLKQISSALELYYSDYGKYPPASSSAPLGRILGCPSPTGSCTWGGSTAFWDSKTTYMKLVPKDPIFSQNYFYRIADSPGNQKYQLYARLESTIDANCLPNADTGKPDCTSPTLPTGFSATACGSAGKCNFSITSPNTTPTE